MKFVRNSEKVENSVAVASVNPSCTEDCKAVFKNIKKLLKGIIGCVAALEYKMKCQHKYMAVTTLTRMST